MLHFDLWADNPEMALGQLVCIFCAFEVKTPGVPLDH